MANEKQRTGWRVYASSNPNTGSLGMGGGAPGGGQDKESKALGAGGKGKLDRNPRKRSQLNKPPKK